MLTVAAVDVSPLRVAPLVGLVKHSVTLYAPDEGELVLHVDAASTTVGDVVNGASAKMRLRTISELIRMIFIVHRSNLGKIPKSLEQVFYFRRVAIITTEPMNKIPIAATAIVLECESGSG